MCFSLYTGSRVLNVTGILIVSCNLAFPSPPSAVHVPTSIDHRSLSVGRLPATLSARPVRRDSPSSVSQGRKGFATLGVSATGESLRTHPQDNDVDPTRRQALLATATTATALIDTASLSPALVPTGFMNYRLPAPRSSGPALPWNPKHREVLAAMDENFNTSLKFHHVTNTERSGFAPTGALLTP